MLGSKIKLLKSLIEIPSPSGFEQEIANFIRQELIKVLPRTRVQVDFQNNVIATIPGTSDRTVIIDAHLDEIGFIVKNVSKGGYISIDYIGGGDESILSARHLTILSEKGTINAVVNRRHAHLNNNDEEADISRICEAQVDIGVRKRREVFKKIEIGDPVVYKSYFNQLVGDYYAGYGFDDKAGCFILIETIKEIVKSKRKPPVNLIFVFSSQEEVWTSKLRPIVREYKPDLVIEADVTFASDYLGEEELEIETGRCDLGGGIVLYRGVDIHNPTLKLMRNIARKHKIKTQIQASGYNIGYTSTDMTYEAGGVRAVILGIPLRNMHTPVETINLKDLDYGTKLLTNLLLSQNLRSVIEK
jgi:endoglucanase